MYVPSTKFNLVHLMDSFKEKKVHFCYYRIIVNWTLCLQFRGIIMFVISNWPNMYSLNCTLLSPITATNKNTLSECRKL